MASDERLVVSRTLGSAWDMGTLARLDSPLARLMLPGCKSSALGDVNRWQQTKEMARIQNAACTKYLWRLLWEKTAGKRRNAPRM